MTIPEIMPDIQALKRVDKFLLMEFLLHEIAIEECITLDTVQANVPKTVDALQAIARLAQPLGPEDLARNFDHYRSRLTSDDSAG